MMAKDKLIFHSSVHIMPPSSPKRARSCNQARRLQLNNHIKKKKRIPDEGQVYVINPKVDYSNQIQYFFFTMKKYYFRKWREILLVNEPVQKSDANDDDDENGINDSSVFQLELSDEDSSSVSEGEIKDQPHISKPSQPKRIIVKSPETKPTATNQNSEVLNIENESDDISKFIEADLHPPTPMVMPPRRDSQLKSFLRDLVHAKMFHITQLKQKMKSKLPVICIPERLNEPWCEIPEVCKLIVDVVNELNNSTDLSEFFYEMYLDMVEYSFEDGDPLTMKKIFPFEMAKIEYESNEVEQVRCVLNISDRLLNRLLADVLDLS